MAYTPPKLYDLAEILRLGREVATEHPWLVSASTLLDALVRIGYLCPEVRAHLERGGVACDGCGWTGRRGRLHRCPTRTPQVFGRPYHRPRRLRGFYRVWDGFDGQPEGVEYDRKFRSLRGAARFLRTLAAQGVLGASVVRYAKRGGNLATTGKWWRIDALGTLVCGNRRPARL